MFKHAVIRPENHTHYISILYIYIYVQSTLCIYIYLYINFERLISRQRAFPLEVCLDKALDSFPRVLTHKRQRTEISYTSTTHTSTLKDKRFVWCLQDSRKCVPADPKYSSQHSCSAGQPVTLHSEIPPQKTLRKRRSYYHWLTDHLTYTRPAKRSHRG